MKRVSVLASGVLTIVLLLPAASSAQDAPLSNILQDVYIGAISGYTLPPNATAADIAFTAGLLVPPVFIVQTIGSGLANVPLGSSAGGFTYTYDSTIGAFTRTSRSFGPAYAERASTLGRGKFTFGGNYQRVSFDRFSGKDLGDGSIVSSAPVRLSVAQGPLFPAIVENRLSLTLTGNTFALFAGYGVTDRLDVGVAVPYTSVDISASVAVTAHRLDNSAVPFTDFSGEAVPRTIAQSGTASGVGDMVVRTKYRIARSAGIDIAAGADIRLPTGDEENLLGIPGTQASIYGIASSTFGTVFPHVNIGYTFSKGNDLTESASSPFIAPPDELQYAAGVDFALTSRLTVSGDVLGRTLRNYGRLEEDTVQLRFAEASSFDAQLPTVRQFVLRDGNLSLISGVAGVKFNAFRTLLISANVLFALNDSGLRDRVTPSVGFEWAF